MLSRLEYWLDKREYMSREDYKKGTVRPYGFTDYKTIQDFPIRGRSVYLHVRRRKWIDRSTGLPRVCRFFKRGGLRTLLRA